MKKTLYLLGCIVLIIGIVETGLRLFGADIKYKGNAEADITLRDWSNQEMYERTLDGVFYTLKQNKKHNVNDECYRGDKVSFNKSRNTFRILVLGDSTAFGVGVGYKETFCERLCELIRNKSHKKAECVNVGTPGYTSLQGVRLFENKFVKYNPDLVLTYFGNNDQGSILPASDKELKILPKCLIKQYSILSRLKVFNFLQYMYLKHCVYKFSKLKQRVSPDDFKKNLLKIKKISTSLGAKTYFVTAVHLDNEEPEHAQALGKAMHIEFWEAINLIRGLSNSGYSLDELFIDGCHPSVEGHEVIAKIIYNRLISDGAIDKHFAD